MTKATKMKRVTLRQIAQAMIADRTPKTIKALFRKRKVKGEMVQYSCAIGGAALALGLDGMDLMTALGTVPIDGIKPIGNSASHPRWENSVGPFIWKTNDNTHSTKAAIGEQILKTADKATLDTRLTVKVAKEE